MARLGLAVITALLLAATTAQAEVISPLEPEPNPPGLSCSFPYCTKVVGGHYVPIMGRLRSHELTLITWAKRQTMTDAFFQKYCDEAWAYVSPEEITRVTKENYEGFSLSQLEEYLHLVTAAKGGTFKVAPGTEATKAEYQWPVSA